MLNRFGVRASSSKFLPRLERLECRDCPAAPSVMGLAVESGASQFTLTGHVTDEQPGGLTVNISGVYSGSVVTNGNGDFQLQFSPPELGTVYCTVTDGENLTSQPSSAMLMSLMPSITNFGASRSVNDIWTFSGHVNDEYAAGLAVQLGGLIQLQGVIVTVDANGNFSYTAELGVNFQGGTATARTTDWWGQESNVASCFLYPSV